MLTPVSAHFQASLGLGVVCVDVCMYYACRLYSKRADDIQLLLLLLCLLWSVCPSNNLLAFEACCWQVLSAVCANTLVLAFHTDVTESSLSSSRPTSRHRSRPMQYRCVGSRNNQSCSVLGVPAQHLYTRYAQIKYMYYLLVIGAVCFYALGLEVDCVACAGAGDSLCW